MADKFILRVTAGSGYDPSNHVVVPINEAEPIRISNEFMDIELNVRIQNYRGLPYNSPPSSPYFSTEPHARNKDQYSIAFRFTPKGTVSDSSGGPASQGLKDEQPQGKGISGADLQFGNDFDHPIRDRLPPGFNYAMNIVKWWIDPGLEGDAYADEPYLYGPGLSSFNAIHVGSTSPDPSLHDPEKGGIWVEEGGSSDGLEVRKDVGLPEDSKARMKWALKQENKTAWVWEYGREYAVDFFNPYLDFGDFSLRLPGLTLPIMRYWDGQGLRYVLRNRTTSDTYMVILFNLHLKEDVNEDGSLKESATAATLDEKRSLVDGVFNLNDSHSKVANTEADGDHTETGEKALEGAREHFERLGVEKHEEEPLETSPDDVD